MDYDYLVTQAQHSEGWDSAAHPRHFAYAPFAQAHFRAFAPLPPGTHVSTPSGSRDDGDSDVGTDGEMRGPADPFFVSRKRKRERKNYSTEEATRVLLDYWEIDEQLTKEEISDLLEFDLNNNRRVYDILNVLKGANIVMKVKNYYIRLK